MLLMCHDDSFVVCVTEQLWHMPRQVFTQIFNVLSWRVKAVAYQLPIEILLALLLIVSSLITIPSIDMPLLHR